MKSNNDKPGSPWLWVVLLIPYVALLWLPFYNDTRPSLAGFPFFYWYQLLWVLVSAVITAIVYFKTKTRSSNASTGGAR